jgi:hypothetical protein
MIILLMMHFLPRKKGLTYLPRKKGLNPFKEKIPLWRKGLCSLGEQVHEYLSQNYKGKIYPNQNLFT